MAKALTINELRVLTPQDLRTRLQDVRRQLWDLRLKTKAGSVRQVHQVREARRHVAWIETLLREPRARPEGAKVAGAA